MKSKWVKDAEVAALPCVCTSVRKLSRRLSRAYDKALSGSGLNVTQLAAMRGIRRNLNQPLSRIANELAMERTTFYRTIAPLERNGWISIQGSPGGRMRTALITEEGEKVLDAAGSLWAEIQSSLVECYGNEHYAQLLQMIAQMESCLSDIAERTTDGDT